MYNIDHEHGIMGIRSQISSHKFNHTSPGLQIHTVDHTRTANPCDWLPCRRAALPLVGCPHSIVYLHLPVVEGLIFCILATPHLGTSFPLFHVNTTEYLASYMIRIENFVQKNCRYYADTFLIHFSISTKKCHKK